MAEELDILLPITNKNKESLQAINAPKYKVETFDYDEVKESKLCAITDSNGNIIGTGIPKMRSSNNIVVTIDSVQYTFDSQGNPTSKNAMTNGYKINMAASQVKANTTGTVGATQAAFTRSVDSETGNVTYTPSEILDKTYEITIENLNARDQFALQALHTIMEKIPAPDELSKDEITHYCEASYLWASYMMVESSKARAVIEDAETSDNTKTLTVGYLESNTEKLLNNIVAAIERNDIKETVDGKDIYSDRIEIPKLMDFLNNYIKDGNNTVGLKDLITSINDLKTAVSTGFANVVTALNTFTSNMNTRLNTINTAVGNVQTTANTINTNTSGLSNEIDTAKSDIIDAMPSMPSDYATSSELSSAVSKIKGAMPSCKYTPPTT